MVQENQTFLPALIPACFGAANTAAGFTSRFDTLFDPVKYNTIYIIKGGPGTGKSTLMRRIAKAAEEKGQTPSYCYCSSDTKSLDGVILPEKKIAVIDGTAPHMTDPVYPGAVEQLINLSSFFNLPLLLSHRMEIIALSTAMRRLYRQVYAHLMAAGSMDETLCHINEEAFLSDKARGAVLRFVKPLKKSALYYQESRFVSAIGTQGPVYLDALERQVQQHYYLTNGKHSAHLYFELLIKALEDSGIAHVILPNPLCPKNPEGIYLPDTSTVFTVSGVLSPKENDKVINMERFLDKNLLRARKSEIRQTRIAYQLGMDDAFALLHRIGILHDELETFYIQAMDFHGLNQLTDDLITALL